MVFVMCVYGNVFDVLVVVVVILNVCVICWLCVLLVFCVSVVFVRLWWKLVLIDYCIYFLVSCVFVILVEIV